MEKKMFGLLLIAGLCAACSGGQPPESFLKSEMRVMTNVNAASKIGVDTEKLHMKPIDLYNVFDKDIKKKKWKKIHENSWALQISAKNPDSKYEITLVMVPQLDNNVIIKTISVNGFNQDSMDTAAMIRSLDQGFSGAK